MTAEVLAGLCGVTPAYISMIENGKRSGDRYSLITSFAEALRVPVSDITPGLAVPHTAESHSSGSSAASLDHPMLDDDEAVRRRAFLLTMASLMQLADSDPGSRLEAVRRMLEGSPDFAFAGGLRESSPAVAELCVVLTDYGHRFPPAQSGHARPTADLERDVRAAFSTYQQGRFTSAARRISSLLADAQLAARECADAERPRSLRVLALSCQAAASVLTKVGEPGLALVAAERGLNAAEASGDVAVRGSLIRCVAFTLHSAGRFEPAMRLVESGTDYLNGEIRGRDPASVSVYGTLFLVGVMAAARSGDRPRTAYYLQEANEAARRLGRDANHLWTAFGPTNVAIHRVNAAVELGEVSAVLGSGLSVDTRAVPMERRVRYLLDVARVHDMTGNRDHALGTILTAEQMAPDQVRQHYLSRKLVASLVRSAVGKPGTELDGLARRLRIGEFV